MKPQFVWASADPVPPGRWDLRLLGWSMLRPHDLPGSGKNPSDGEMASVPWLLDGRPGTKAYSWRRLAQPELVTVIGLDDPDERAEILRYGVGEVAPMATAVVELGARMTRLVAAHNSVPRYRHAGPVTLDLFHRDGRIGERWLALHPREFGLLWRLAETPGERVGRRELLADVWRLDHVPETNSLQVHVSRLRAKLAISQAAWLVETDPAGGYRLGQNHDSSFFAFSKVRKETLDRHLEMRDDGSEENVIVSDEDVDERTCND